MQSIHLFNEEQTKDFKMICSDLCGPTSMEYVLSVMARAISALECDPEIDPSAFNDEELRKEVLVCLAALDYADIKRVLESK